MSELPMSDGEESEWCDELDHIPLIQRREMLLANRSSSFHNIVKPSSDNIGVIELRTEVCGLQYSYVPSDSNSLDKMNSSSAIHQKSHSEVNDDGIGLEKVEARVPFIAQNMTIEKPPEIKVEPIDNVQDPIGDIVNGSLSADIQVPQLERNDSNDCPDDLDNLVLRDRLKMLPPRKMLGLTNLSHEVKAEYSDEVLENMKHCVAPDCPSVLPQIKNEPEIINAHENMADHVLLGDRMKIQTIGEDSELSHFDFLMRTVHTAAECGPSVPETSKPLRINRPRKRKKTATDSLETALEEDAPGLLQVLIGEGISVDEIKLYGEEESNEIIDDSFTEDEFAELESVISKLFFQRNSLLKLPPLRCPKASKPIYFLGCLFSLVEQTRYLKFRNWPAEWGWCRDLQSFIFVFERHRRIVLERPEYGYATYFFELVTSLPVDWQIKRLVTCMKLTSCSRITLIENKALMVGEDLTEGEAQVLIQFGWTPNSGLGTMLNYCDRVVHDRKNDKDTSEWRSKIGKLLVDGYNGGGIVSSNVEMNAVKHETGESFQTEVEL